VIRKVNDISKKDAGIFFFSILISTYIWRLHVFGFFVNVLLILGIINGIIKHVEYFKIPKYFGNKLLYFIILGIIISFLVASYFRGSMIEQLKLNSIDTALTIRRIIEGLLLFFLIVLNIDSKYKLFKFLDVLLYFSLFFTLLMLSGLSDEFVGFIGLNVYNIGDLSITHGVETIRRSFATLDEGAFGGIMLVFALYSILKYFNQRPDKIYIIFFVIFSTAAIYTLSRTVTVKFVVALLVYIFLSFKINFKNTSIVLIILSISIIILINTSVGQDQILRFSEIFYNLQELFRDNELIARDSFQFRLLRALAGVPAGVFGWIFGSGGIQTGRLTYNSGSDHIEYTNWLWQFGLITFIPFILYLFSLVRISLKLNRKTNSRLTKHLTALSISILIGLMLHMVGGPSFYFLWIWTAFSVIMINISRKMEQLKSI
jgi:hypothetical protein